MSLAVVYGVDAVKVLAVAAPVAGLVAVAHVRSSRRRHRAMQAEAAVRSARSVYVEAPGPGGMGSVSFDLTPQLLGGLAAAQSGSLRGMDCPDAVMLALEVDALWRDTGAEADDDRDSVLPSQLVATRELCFVRSADRDSARIGLGKILEAHRKLPEGEPIYCTADGGIQLTPPKRLRASSMPAQRQFYWVRAESAAADAGRQAT